ncbi:MAG: putative toxin-antitoxin system toxin component, PIN family [Rubrivivax sp.]|nr:putative toxin-antitoxin system toxin component, PIN family [Rubrivivax sp.]
MSASRRGARSRAPAPASSSNRPTDAAPRTVLDTSVVLSALVFGGGPTAQLRQAWQSGRLLPLVSTATVQELMRVLAYPKFKLTAEDQRELLADYLPWTEVVTVPEPPPPVPACRDPHDLPFLHLAVAGRAELLVSGDADLLALAGPGTRPRLRCRVLTVQAALQLLQPLALR